MDLPDLCASIRRSALRVRFAPDVFDRLASVPENALPAALESRIDPQLAPGECVVMQVDGTWRTLRLDGTRRR